MKPTLLLLSLAGLLLLSLANPQPALCSAQTVCSQWLQVNDPAFGLGPGADGSYASEEGYEVEVFNDRLYLGMEADNSLGARLWRTRAGVLDPSSQADWEEVAADASGHPFGNPDLAQNDHIDSLAGFKGYLYASTANRGSGGQNTTGTRLYRSPSGDPGTWQDAQAALGPGFGDVHNENFKDMQVFGDWLCGGTWNEASGAQVWCSQDGLDWQPKNTGGFGQPNNFIIWSGAVYNQALYFGVENRGLNPLSSTDDVGRLYRAASLDGTPAWTEVFSSTAGSNRVDLLGDIGGYLYLSVRSAAGLLVYRSPSGNLGTWTQVNTPGMDGNPHNLYLMPDGSSVYNGALYLGAGNLVDGFSLWRTTGLVQSGRTRVDWTQVGAPGLGDPNNVLTELIPFNGNLFAWTTNYVTGQQVLRSACPSARYIILLIGDGMGSNHIQAADAYSGAAAEYEPWARYWMSTFPAGGSYDPAQAWTNFSYVLTGPTDSAAAATAMFTGSKTANGRISVSADGTQRLYSLSDKARLLGKAVGAVTSVALSDATPGAWYAHNDSRTNGFAIGDEGLWGDPNTTGSPAASAYYLGGHGPSLPALDVLLGAGNPAWNGANFINQAQRDKLATESARHGQFTYVERLAGSPDGGARLGLAAANSSTLRLAGLFGGVDAQLEYRLADGSGANPEEPSLAQMTLASLDVLARSPDGFILLVEGGSIDHAAHSNNMNAAVGEVLGFDQAVQSVVAWVDDPATPATWQNTLVIVTADHETGYLTAGPGLFPNQPLGEVSPRTLALEKPQAGSGLRASWEDTNLNSQVDPGETVYWAWNSAGHTNNLAPLYARGVGANLFGAYLASADPQRGVYLDNTDLYSVMDAVLLRSQGLEPGGPTALTITHQAGHSPTHWIYLFSGLLSGTGVGGILLGKRRSDERKPS